MALHRTRAKMWPSPVSNSVIRMNLNNIISIFPILLFLIVGCIFLYVYSKSRSLLEIEKDITAILNESCTSYLDGMKNLLTRVTFYDDFMVISSRRKIILKYEEISEVKEGKVLWAKSLDIVRKNKSLPSISLLFKNLEIPLQLLKSKCSKKYV